MPESSNRAGALIDDAEPTTLIMSSPSLITRAVFGWSVSDPTPPPKYRYAEPSSSISTAGSTNQITPATPGVEDVISAFANGSTNGPDGESDVSTPMPPALLAKYRKNFSLPLMVL